jgi:hypothetical protein
MLVFECSTIGTITNWPKLQANAADTPCSAPKNMLGTYTMLGTLVLGN